MKLIALLITFTCLVPSFLYGASFASRVVSYDSGVILAPTEIGPPEFADPTTALGSPDGVTGEIAFGGLFPNVLSPFSPAFDPDEVVEIGPGGELTLQLSRFVEIGPGFDLGVFANAGLEGVFGGPPNFEFMGAKNPATAFGAEAASLEVSEDGTSWTALNASNPILFDMPSDFYVNAGVFDAAPPSSPVLADFSQPIAPDLSVFDGADEAAVKTALSGSAGGYWLDLSATGLNRIGYVRFSVPTSALPPTPFDMAQLDAVVFELDAVSIAAGKAGAIVPEPSTLVLLSSLFVLGVWSLSRRAGIVNYGPRP